MSGIVDDSFGHQKSSRSSKSCHGVRFVTDIAVHASCVRWSMPLCCIYKDLSGLGRIRNSAKYPWEGRALRESRWCGCNRWNFWKGAGISNYRQLG